MARTVLRSCTLVLLLALGWSTPSSAQDKPLLSQEIRAVLERDGAEAAERRFSEIFPAHKDEYVVDVEGIAQLGGELAQGGDYPGAQAIGRMAAVIAQDMMASGGVGRGAVPMPSPAPPRAPSPRREARPAPAAAPSGPPPEVRALMGEPRDDLDRFVGQYGDPAAQDGTPRNLFAAKRCDGYLVVGATWGGASNWHMRSTSDLAFEADVFAGQMVHVTFQMAPDGTPQSLTHDWESLDSPLQYVGPLPEGWVEGGCMQPPMR